MVNLILDFVLPANKSKYTTFEDYVKEVKCRMKTTAAKEMDMDFKETLELLYNLDDETYKSIRKTRIEYNFFKKIIPYVNKGLRTDLPAKNAIALINISNTFNGVISRFITEIIVRNPEWHIRDIAEHIKECAGAVLYCQQYFLREIAKYNVSDLTKDYIDTISTYDSVRKALDEFADKKAKLKLYAEAKYREGLRVKDFVDREVAEWKRTRGNPKKLH